MTVWVDATTRRHDSALEGIELDFRFACSINMEHGTSRPVKIGPRRPDALHKGANSWLR